MMPAFGPPSMIASDVDGTLIDNANRITERTAATLERARSEGSELVLATGRPPRWIPEITDQLAHTPAAIRYAVCANGAIVYDVVADRILHVEALQPDAMTRIADLCTELLPGCGLAAERVGSSAFDAATAPFVATPGYEHAWLNPDHVYVSQAEVVAEPAVKLLVRMPHLSSREMAATVAPHLGDLAEATFSIDTGLVEFSVPATHKAAGLAWLAEYRDVDATSPIAFGDMPNDVEMLRWATHGVAMGHGDPAALEVADEITASNVDDGVAKVLERWF
ncbi:HAD family hydrolase [Gordonia hydrophobica]|uniref:HAD family hydrolase n=1 Tax=Gordonia hydrophobica TaxID=40516 RepID=A0ABZ2U768_9ACTN|nr:HAD family hydrolase [Gordonia hydrophobica]MBM7368190.1 Cof subfamily protein (haloacid dehalogenase superfamily) [Gordonia hydrophobica]